MVAGLHFTERMKGFFSTRVDDGYDAGLAQGSDDGSAIEFVLTIAYDDLDLALREPSTRARVWGTVTAPELSKRRMVATGDFRLLVPEPCFVETWRMLYDLRLCSEDGESFRFNGFKRLRERGSLHAWPDSTTLYVDVGATKGDTRGVGIMRISPGDFVRQLRTIAVDGVADPSRRRAYRLAFVRMFAGSLLGIYGGLLDEAGRFPLEPVPPRQPKKDVRESRLPPHPEVHVCGGDDRWNERDSNLSGDWLRLVRYKGNKGKGPVLVAPGFGMSASSYLATTTDTNLTEYLYEAGYDTWLFDYRAGTELLSARKQFSFDDIALRDWPMAVKKVRDETSATEVEVGERHVRVDAPPRSTQRGDA
jgi:cholesterol oxidase